MSPRLDARKRQAGEALARRWKRDEPRGLRDSDHSDIVADGNGAVDDAQYVTLPAAQPGAWAQPLSCADIACHLAQRKPRLLCEFGPARRAVEREGVNGHTQTRKDGASQAAVMPPCSPFKRDTNTCFVVATSTLLCSLKPFAEKLCAVEPVGPLVQALQEAFSAAAPFLGGGTAKEVSLEGLLNCMTTSGSALAGLRQGGGQQQQQDAAEFLQVLLQQLPGRVVELLRTKSESWHNCNRCGTRWMAGTTPGCSGEQLAREMTEIEAYVDALTHLPMVGTDLSLKALYDASLSSTLLSDFTCPVCKCRGETHKSLTRKLNKVALFCLTRHANNLAKRLEHVKLEVEPVLDGAQYRLVSVIEHEGTSMNSGHYITYVRVGARWFCYDRFDLGPCAEISEEDVLQRQAYIVAYQRVDDMDEKTEREMKGFSGGVGKPGAQPAKKVVKQAWKLTPREAKSASKAAKRKVKVFSGSVAKPEAHLAKKAANRAVKLKMKKRTAREAKNASKRYAQATLSVADKQRVEQLKHAAMMCSDNTHVMQTLHAALSHLTMFSVSAYVHEATTAEEDCAAAIKAAEENALTPESAADAVAAARAVFEKRTRAANVALERTAEELEANALVTDADKQRCFAAYSEKAGNACTLLSCGACGLRDGVEDQSAYTEMRLERLAPALFRYTAEEEEALDNAPTVAFVSSTGSVIHMPTAGFHNFFRDDEGVRWKLYGDLITRGEDGAVLHVCESCFKCINNGKKPPRSLAAGVEFGRLPHEHDDAGYAQLRELLPELKLAESLVLAQVRTYVCALKLAVHNEDGSLASRGNLQGHVISFYHSAPEDVAQALAPTREKLLRSLNVVLVGPDSKIDLLRLRAQIMGALNVRGFVLHNWLALKKALDPAYAHLELPTPAQLEAEFEGVAAELVQNARELTDSALVRADDFALNVDSSDIACVRTSAEPMDVDSDGATRDNRDDLGALHGGAVPDPIMSHVGVIGSTRSAGDTLHGVINSLRVTVDQALGEPPQGNQDALKVPRDAVPVNEFLENGNLIMRSFPELFLFGRGLEMKAGASRDVERHLAMHYTCRFARKRPLLLLLMNQAMRHAACQSVSVRVRDDEASTKAMAALLARPDFYDQLRRAEADPESKDAEKLLKQFYPFITLSGKRIPFSRIERQNNTTHLLNLSRFLCIPCVFGTVAIDDAHMPKMMRLSVRSVDNDSFPALVSSASDDLAFIHALQRGEAVYDERFVMDERNIQRLASDNPVACAAVFQSVVEAFTETLLGLPLADKTRKSSLPDSTPRGPQFTFACERAKGVFGHLTGYFGVVECSGRKTLHFHFLGYGGIAPAVLQQLAAMLSPGRGLTGPATGPDVRQRLAAAVRGAIDSVYCATASPEIHALHAAVKAARVSHRGTYFQPQRHAAVEEVRRAGEIGALFSGFHEKCVETCRKPPAGKHGCRMSMFAGHPVPSTHAVQLSDQPSSSCFQEFTCAVHGHKGDDNRAYPHPVDELEPQSHLDRSDPALEAPWPLRPKDARALAFELERPNVTPANEFVQLAAQLMDAVGLPPEVTDDADAFREAMERLEDADAVRFVQEAFAEASPTGALLLSKGVPVELLLKLRRLTPGRARAALAALSLIPRCRNGGVVAYNVVCTAALNCNTAMYFLGCSEQARAALFYLVKYMTKDSVKVSASMAVLLDAKQHLDKYPSTAEDSGCPDRTVKHFVTRVLNKLSGAQEVADTQAALRIVGGNAWFCSHTFRNFSAWSVLRDAMGDRVADIGLSVEDDRVSDGLQTAGRHQFADDEVGIDAIVLRSGGTRGTSTIHKGADDKVVTVSFMQNYHHRGPALASLSPYAYSLIVEVAKKRVRKPAKTDAAAEDQEPADEEDAPDDEERRNSGAGRRANAKFAFADGHPLSGSHEQRLRSKFPVPIFTGASPPPPPKNVPPEERDDAWHRSADRFASFCLSIFTPWDLTTKKPFTGLTWLHFCAYMHLLEEQAYPVSLEAEREADLQRDLARATITLIDNLAYGLRVDDAKKKLGVQYRTRCRFTWAADRGDDGARNRRHRDDDCDEAARQLIDDLVAEMEATNANSSAVQSAALNAQWVQFTVKGLQDSTRHLDASIDTATAGVATKPPGSAATDAVYLRDPDAASVREVAAAFAKTEPACRTEGMDDDDDAAAKENRPAVNERMLPDAKLPPHHADAQYYLSSEWHAVTDAEYEEQKAAWVADGKARGKPPPLNPEQRSAGRQILLWLHFKFVLDMDVGPPPKLLIHGAPGVGKSVLILALNRAIGKMDFSVGVVINTAFTGVAASPLPNGRTLHNLVSLSVDEAGKNIKADQPVGAAVMRWKQLTRGRKVALIIIDEVSFLAPRMLWHVHERMRVLIDNDKQLAFGGVPVLLLGDFFQKDPCQGKSLAVSLAMRTRSPGTHGDAGSPDGWGCELFATFKRVELERQMRAADCALQQRVVTEMRDTSAQQPITTAWLKSLRTISAEDVAKDPGWADAPVAVLGHHERLAITKTRAQSFAKRNGEVLIRWKLAPTKAVTGRQRALLNDLYDHELGLWDYFVRGAPCMTKENINPSRRLANGTECTAHGLYWEDPAEQAAAIAAISCGAAGDIVEVPVPTAVIVRLDGEVVDPRDAACTLQAGTDDAPAQYLVPILISHGAVSLHSVAAALRGLQKQEVRVYTHNVWMLFAATDFALQGKTKTKLILSFASRCFMPHHTIKSVYVMASRATTAEGLRVTPSPPGESIFHLANLRHHPAQHAWNCGYDAEGKWCPEKANAAYERALAVAGPKPRARRRAPLALRPLAASALQEMYKNKQALRDMRRCKNVNCVNVLDKDCTDLYCEECNTRCSVCNSTDDVDFMICDNPAKRNHGAHMTCLGLSVMPAEDETWYCDECETERHDIIAAAAAAAIVTTTTPPPASEPAAPPTQAHLREAHRAHFQGLNATQRARVDAALSRSGEPTDVVVDHRDDAVFSPGRVTGQALQSSKRAPAVYGYPSDLTRRVVDCLNRHDNDQHDYLNDLTMNAYLATLMAYQLKLNNVQPRVHFFNTFFYLKLYKQHSAYNFKAVSRTLNGLGYDAARCDKLMVPIHHRRVMHWTCAEIDRRAATITHFDSLGEGAVTSSSTLILQNLKRYMQDLDKQNGLPSSAWSLVVAQDTPQQRNLCDCGVFALMTCKWRALDLPFSYDQRDADYFRRRIMSDIIDLAGPAQVSTAKRALFETPPPADAARNVRARR